MAQERAGVVCPRKAPQSSPWIYFCCSVAMSYPTLCDLMDCSRPGFSDFHCLLEFAQIHIYSVGNAILPSHSLLPYSSFAFNLSQHQGLFQWVNSSHQMANVFELQLQYQSFQWLFSIDFLQDWLVWSPCSPMDSQESSPAQFKRINSSALTLEPKEIKSVTDSNFSPICYEVMGLDAMILVFWMLSFNSASSLSRFTLIKVLFRFSSLLPVGWYHLHIWDYWYFSQQSWLQLVGHPSNWPPVLWPILSFPNLLLLLLLSRFSHVRLLATPWTAAYQAPPSMGFSRQEYWSGARFANIEKMLVKLLNCFHNRLLNIPPNFFLC